MVTNDGWSSAGSVGHAIVRQARVARSKTSSTGRLSIPVAPLDSKRARTSRSELSSTAQVCSPGAGAAGSQSLRPVAGSIRATRGSVRVIV